MIIVLLLIVVLFGFSVGYALGLPQEMLAHNPIRALVKRNS